LSAKTDIPIFSPVESLTRNVHYVLFNGCM